MRLKPAAAPVALLLAVLFAFAIPACHSQPSGGEGPQFIFTVAIGQFDWSTRTIEAPIHIEFNNLPASFGEKDEKGQYLINAIKVEFQQWHNEGEVTLYRVEGGPQISFMGSLPENRFNFRGLTELYPYDSYMLNITFTTPSLGLIDIDNTVTKPEPLEAGFTLREGEGPSGKPFTITYATEGGVEEAVVNFEVYLYRTPSSIDLIMQVLIICFFLVGSIPLIKPDKLEHRLTICLSLFIFAVTFTFTIPIPAMSRATLAESLIFTLLTGAGLFSVVSVVERAVQEARPRLMPSRFVLEGLVVLFLANAVRGALEGLVTPSLAAEYPWSYLPPYLLPLLVVALAFGYAILVVGSLANLLWKGKGRVRTPIASFRKPKPASGE